MSTPLITRKFWYFGFGITHLEVTIYSKKIFHTQKTRSSNEWPRKEKTDLDISGNWALVVWQLNSIQHNTLDLACCGSHSLGVHLTFILCSNNFRLRLLTLYDRICIHSIRNLGWSHQQISHPFKYFMKISSMLSLIFLDCCISA